jgi:phosphotransferase system  glucose/maltose/N-acetylglucosamine-specific IIC component
METLFFLDMPVWLWVVLVVLVILIVLAMALTVAIIQFKEDSKGNGGSEDEFFRGDS